MLALPADWIRCIFRTMLFAALLALLAGFANVYATDWRRPGAQKEAVCQGSCGGGCGACPTPRQEGSDGPDYTQINAAKAKANALNDEGIAAWNRGLWGIAREKFQQAYANNRDSKVIFTNLVNATHKVGQEDIEKGDWENAKNTFQSALYHVPDSEEFKRLYALTSQKAQEQREKWAAEKKQNQQLDQQYSRAHQQYKLGVAAGENGDWVTAENYFRTASQLFPDEPGFLKNVAWALTKQGDLAWKKDDYAQMLTLASNAQKIDPDNAYAKKQAARAQIYLDGAERDRLALAQKKGSEHSGFVPSGNGLIGGTTWIAGYNVPAGSSPALRAKAKKMLREQAELAGIPYNEAVDFERYNFVLGIAKSTSAFTDLRKRVLFDNLSNGKETTQMQAAYNSLKGRSFDELDCHSNGAMICLAALENKDIIADRVVLYGPQITPESLALWQGLILSRRVRSVQIYINQNDPVPAVAMLFSSKAALKVGLFNVNNMDRVIREAAPGVGVKVFSCGGSTPTLDCHDLRMYKTNRGCNRTSSGQIVPGTALPGGRGVLEPPPPC